jgi:hypothetical protein
MAAELGEHLDGLGRAGYQAWLARSLRLLLLPEP